MGRVSLGVKLGRAARYVPELFHVVCPCSNHADTIGDTEFSVSKAFCDPATLRGWSGAQDIHGFLLADTLRRSFE